jgi:hypothetical protein
MTDTLSETLNALRQQGYTEDFNLHENHLKDSKGQYKFFPDDFHIDKVYRFDGMTDPADETVLYQKNKRFEAFWSMAMAFTLNL